MSSRILIALLAGVAPTPLLAQAMTEASVQPPAAVAEPEAAVEEGAPLPEEGEEVIEGGAIVVTGSRLRGAVEGDIPPEIVLDPRDIRATGAGSIAELLEAIAPQTRSGSGRGGGRPVMLLNGRRISGFNEIRDIPPEAIERVDILPEAVALRYGYRADQRVVNIVLRRRFDAVTAQLEGGMATAGGRGSYEADLNYLNINQAGRLSLDFEYEHADALFESERDIIQSVNAPAGDGDFRTLLAETDSLQFGGTLARTLFGDVAATLNGRLELNDSESGLGLAADGRALTRESDSRTATVGIALNGQIRPWRWSFTGNYTDVSSDTLTERSDSLVADRSETTNRTGSASLVMNGPVFTMPAGEVSATVRGGFDTRDFSSTALRGGVQQDRDLSRDRFSLQANIDVPIASRREGVLDAMGDLSANFNAEIEHFSDFGTLRTLGAGLNWSPIEQINLGVTYTNEDGAPEMNQLGDPLVATPNVRVFDFIRGETVDITRLEGGNPGLIADNRRELALRFNARPFEGKDISFIAGYTDSSIRNPIAGFPTATPEIEAAFPERFTRDASGRLVQIDSRPVNFERSDRRQLRWGVNFSEPIGPQRPQGGWRGRMGQGQGGGQRPQGETPQQGGQQGQPQQGQGAQQGQGQGSGPVRIPGGGGGRGFGGGGRGFGGGGFGGGGGGGRLQLALFHTWHLENSILIREGLEPLDLLNGSATGSRGGQPRHELELQAGIFKDGLGARMTGNWRSGTTVRGIADPASGTTSNDLFFSDTATVNLRLFADLGQQRSLIRAVPFFRGTRVTLAVDNLFDSRPGVRDSTGATPLSYQPDYLDPQGRSFRISLRKVFF